MSGSIRNLEREYSCTVRLLDDTEYTCSIQVSHLSAVCSPSPHSSARNCAAFVSDLAKDTKQRCSKCLHVPLLLEPLPCTHRERRPRIGTCGLIFVISHNISLNQGNAFFQLLPQPTSKCVGRLWDVRTDAPSRLGCKNYGARPIFYLFYFILLYLSACLLAWCGVELVLMQFALNLWHQ